MRCERCRQHPAKPACHLKLPMGVPLPDPERPAGTMAPVQPPAPRRQPPAPAPASTATPTAVRGVPVARRAGRRLTAIPGPAKKEMKNGLTNESGGVWLRLQWVSSLLKSRPEPSLGQVGSVSVPPYERGAGDAGQQVVQVWMSFRSTCLFADPITGVRGRRFSRAIRAGRAIQE